jgi:hypothetical protein
VYGWTLLALASAVSAPAQLVKLPDCVVDIELWMLPKCALEIRDGKLYLSKQFLLPFFASGSKALGAPTPKSNQLASALLPDGGWAYFDRTGLVVVRNVAPFDNGPSDFHHGLVRVTKGNKWGLSDFHGILAVPLTYDGIMEYDDEKGWLACSACHIEKDREYSFFRGGTWVWLDQHGKVSAATNDPSLLKDQKEPN